MSRIQILRLHVALIFALLFQCATGSSRQTASEVFSAEDRGKVLRQKADAGDARSQVELGIMYASGDGLPTDEAEAVRWFRKAAEQGYAAGEYSLGEMYSTGRGVPLNYEEAFKWLHRSAEQGDPRGQYNLAAMYATGNGVDRNDNESAKWMRKSAEQGFAGGQFGLGAMYAHGRGVPHDDAEAVRWYRKATKQGDLAAANNLSLLLATSQDPHVRNRDEAIEIALKLVDANPQEPTVLDTLAATYYEAGQQEKAAETEQRALVLNPDKTSYKEALQKYLAASKQPKR
jgi:TPR repeat protein